MDSFFKRLAEKVPAQIRKHILDEKFIDKAVNIDARNTPMEYLFDVYNEFVDTAGEHADWTCPKCREHVLSQWRHMKKHLLLIENGTSA